MKHMHRNISISLVVLASILFVFVGCSDMMAIAELAERSYTVTFDSQAATTDANPTSKRVISPATTIERLPIVPKKAGYIFGGWYTGESGSGSEFTASTKVTGDMTVYAKLTDYISGDTGPAGGIVFYENNDYATDGWRYLEAAPTDLLLDDSGQKHIFGYYKTSPEVFSVVENGTGTEIGDGKANTEALVAAMGSGAYVSNDSGNDVTTANYAARLCDILEVGAYDDWFLPSKDELNEMYQNWDTNKQGDFYGDSYWSSSEGSADDAWSQYFSSGNQYSYSRNYGERVRAVRAF
jgi:uncharacterized repeat protein (TIGR02543 family)